jgi:uncharacterized protein (TIGR03437 family)
MVLDKLKRSTKFLMAFALPVAAWADISGSGTLNTGNIFNFDTGVVVTSGGDITFTGSSMTYQGTAKGGVLPGVSGMATYNSVSLQVLQQLAPLATSAPIPASSLTVGAIVAVQTNAGNGAKFIVTAVSSSQLAFQFTTFGATSGGGGGGGAGAPTITNVLNNSSLIPSGFPNSGLTPSTLFHVFGTNMATPGTTPVLQDSTKGLPSTLNGTSISVTVNGTKVQPAIYYSSPTDVAGVLPANTPTGSGTLTVTYNNQSANANIQVVATAFGFDIYNGAAVATDAVSGALITYTNSAQPGQTLLFWGTGVGADPNHSDTVGGANDNINVPVTFYVGGVQAKVVFTGALFYPGVQGFGVTIPDGVPAGCFVPVVAVTGSGASQAVSSIPTIPVMPSGGTCTDSLFGINGGSLGTLGSQTTVKSGSILVGQGNSGTTVADIAVASFNSVPGSSYAGFGSLVSLGGCVLSETNTNLILPGTTVTPTPLDAGSIKVQGPLGTYNLSSLTKGSYLAQLPAGAIPATGGAFTFTGSGGADIGAFTGTVTLPNPLLAWTNQSAAATVARSQGIAISWTGGAPGTYVIITGGSVGSGGASGTFICFAPQSAGSFTVPSYITASLPAGNGSVTVENGTNITPFTAPGLDYGYGFGYVAASQLSTFQ